MSRVLRAAPLILNERGNILTSTEIPTNSKAETKDRNPPQHPEERTPEEEGAFPKMANLLRFVLFFVHSHIPNPPRSLTHSLPPSLPSTISLHPSLSPRR